MQKKLWVFSLDALGSNDRELFESLPGFSRLIQESSYIPNMRGIYPTLTYPSHVTILTGRRPSSHGIVNNERFEPHRVRSEWFWFERLIQGDSLIRAGKRKGKTIGAFLWPVNAGAKIEANFAEIFPTQAHHKQLIRSLFNSTWNLLLPVERKYGHVRKGAKQPELDEYTMGGAKYLLDTIDPDMAFIHLLDIDSSKHLYGTSSKGCQDAIIRMDQRVQRILEWRDERKEPIDLVFLSDHSQIDTPKMLYPLSDFQRKSLLQAEEGRVLDYTLCPHSAGGSCFIYAKNPLDGEKEKKMRDFLISYMKNQEGIEAVLFQEDLRKEGADPKAFAALEAKKGYAFSAFFEDSPYAVFEKDHHLANHGFHPDKPNYDAVFFATGPSFMRGIRLDERNSLLNIAPTLSYCHQLGLKAPEGQVISEILNKEALI